MAIANLLSSIQSLADNTFFILTRCESIAATDPAFEWAKALDTRVPVADLRHSERDARSLLQGIFNKKLGERLKPDLAPYGYKWSVVVYFLPGSWVHLPLYFTTSGFLRSDSFNRWTTSMDDRLEELSQALRHPGAPEVAVGKSLQRQSHLFFFTYVHASVLAIDSNSLNRSKLELDDPAGYYRANIWIKLNKNTSYTFPYRIVEPETGKLWNPKNIWTSGSKVPAVGDLLLASPIFVSHDTLVSLASYFDRNLFFKKSKKKQETLQDLLIFHGSLAREVFAPLYANMLRGDRMKLKANLERHHISSNLLDRAAEKLGPPPKQREKYKPKSKWYFWYNWADERKDEENLSKETTRRYSNDFRWSIQNDIIQNPENVFRHILKLETSIYKHLTREVNGRFRRLAPSSTMKLPRAMPLSELLQRVEAAARDLGALDRDHIIHQFHVFLLGALVIRTNLPEFRKHFEDSLSDLGFRPLRGLKDRYLAVDAFIKTAWFLVATLHDVGRPVQRIDTLVGDFRREVGKLVGLQRLDKSSRLHVDRILYDDPRTYLLFRKVANWIAVWLGDTASPAAEDWWYFFRYLAFGRKEHEFASVLAVGLAITKNISKTRLALLLDNDDPVLKFIVRHILMPIMFHHAYEWSDRVSDLERGSEPDAERDSKPDSVKSTSLRQVAATVRRLVGKMHKGRINKRPELRLRFDTSPLTVLLALCDLLQEEHRPSGGRLAFWPESDADCLPLGQDMSVNYVVNLTGLSLPNLMRRMKGDDIKIGDFMVDSFEDFDSRRLRGRMLKAMFELTRFKNTRFEGLYHVPTPKKKTDKEAAKRCIESFISYASGSPMKKKYEKELHREINDDDAKRIRKRVRSLFDPDRTSTQYPDRTSTQYFKFGNNS